MWGMLEISQIFLLFDLSFGSFNMIQTNNPIFFLAEEQLWDLPSNFNGGDQKTDSGLILKEA